jgi:hypothetical protein
MDFKQFITENYDAESIEDKTSIDSTLLAKLNLLLLVELTEPVLTPEAGLSKIRKILYTENLAFEPIFDLEEEGDEIAVHLTGENFLYILYYPTDDGYYDFYAEVTDEEGINDAMADTEGEETE